MAKMETTQSIAGMFFHPAAVSLAAVPAALRLEGLKARSFRPKQLQHRRIQVQNEKRVQRDFRRPVLSPRACVPRLLRAVALQGQQDVPGRAQDCPRPSAGHAGTGSEPLRSHQGHTAHADGLPQGCTAGAGSRLGQRGRQGGHRPRIAFPEPRQLLAHRGRRQAFKRVRGPHCEARRSGLSAQWPSRRPADRDRRMVGQGAADHLCGPPLCAPARREAERRHPVVQAHRHVPADDAA